MICSNCGSQVPEGSKFCPVCGAKAAETLMNEAGQTVQNEMSAQTQPLDQYAQPQQQYAQPQQQYAQPQQQYAQPQQQYAQPQQQYAQPQQQYAQPQQQYAQPQQYAQAYAPAAVAKNGLGTGVKVLIAVLSIVAVLGIVFAVFSSQIINFFKQMTMSDAEYLQSKTLEATSDFTDLAALSYGKVASNEGAGAELTFDLELGDGLLNMLKLSGADFSWFKSVGGNVKASVTRGSAGGEMSVKLNENELLSATLTLENGKVYISVPDLTDKVAVIDVAALSKAMNGGSSGSLDMSGVTEVLKKITEALPDPEETEELIDRYVKVVVESIDNVEKTSDTYTVDQISQKASLYTAKITSVEAKKIAENVLKTLRDDADVKKIIEDLAEATGSKDLTYDNFKEEISNSLDKLDSIKFEGAAYYKMWVNSSGEVLGTEFNVDSEEFKAQIRGRSAFDGDKFAYEEIAVVNGQNILLVGGSGTKSGDRITGSFLVKFNEINMMTISCKDFEVESGHLNGQMTVSLEKDFIKAVAENGGSGFSGFDFMAYESGGNDLLVNMLSNLKIVCDFESSTGHSKTVLKIMMGESEYLKAVVELNQTPVRSFSLPSGNEFEISSERDLDKWAKTFDPSKLIGALQKAGVPQELLNGIN